MKQKKVQSLSRKLFVNFILSCLLPIVVVSFLVSYLFGTYQYQEIRSRAENNTKLISAYMTKYLNDIDNLTKAPYYHSFFQSRTPFEDLTGRRRNWKTFTADYLFQRRFWGYVSHVRRKCAVF